jgi:hypothetical protein
MMVAVAILVGLTGVAAWFRRVRMLRVLVVAVSLVVLGFCADRLHHITRNAGTNSGHPPDLAKDDVYNALRQADAYARPYLAVVLAASLCLAILAALPVDRSQSPPK